jgi:tetratricopeptide (TPR) repeat protein
MISIDKSRSQIIVAESPWWDAHLPSSDEEIYQSLVRVVRRTIGFGLIFVSCSQKKGDEIVQDLGKDLPQRKSFSLSITQPIDNLFDLMAEISDIQNIDTIFIEGLEDSIFAYEDREFKDISFRSRSKVYGGTTVDVPPLFAHLNMQRERFKESFPICLIFLVRDFTLSYFVRRAPDFFDWRSASFSFNEGTQDRIKGFFKAQGWNLEHQNLVEEISILEVKMSNTSDNHEKCLSGLRIAQLLALDGQLETSLLVFDQLLQFEKNNRFDKSIELEIWKKRGDVLIVMDRYAEAKECYEQSLLLDPKNPKILYDFNILLQQMNKKDESYEIYKDFLESSSMHR